MLMNSQFSIVPQLLEKYDECPICYEKFKVDNLIRLLPNCKHIFHRNCIDQWLEIRGMCPFCKESVRKKKGCFFK